MDAGETVKADHMKKQLPYCTITATYAKERLAYSLDKYQDIITLDCDDMPAEKIPEFRQLVNDCPDTKNPRPGSLPLVSTLVLSSFSYWLLARAYMRWW